MRAWRWIFLTLFGIVLSGTACIAAPTVSLTIGVLAWRGEEKARLQWEPTRATLQAAFPEYNIVLRPISLKGMEAALVAQELDFFITNPGNYIEMEQRYGASRLVTLESVRVGAPAASVGAIIFSRSDRSDIRKLADLRGKTLLGVSRDAFGGFQIGWGVLQQAGIDPFTDMAGVTFAGFPLDNIVTQVANGRADVGTVRACLLEEMAQEGRIEMDDFRILNPQHVDGFNCALSSPLYPNWPFAKARQTNHILAKRVAVALLKMSPESKGGAGQSWTIPLSYQPVTELFKSLRIGPYTLSAGQVFREFLQRNKGWFLLALALVILAALHVWHTEFLVFKRTRQLKESQEKARLRLAELAHVSRQTTLGEMARGLAHEINQPLGSISNYAAGSVRMIKNGVTSAQLEEPLREIAHQAEHAGRVLKRIRGFVDNRESPRKQADINALLTEAIDLLGAELRQADITVQSHLAHDLPPLSVDGVAIEQVAVNLIRNAIEAMAQQATGPRILNVISERDKRDDTRLRVTIRDSGPGLDADALEHMGTSKNPPKSGLTG
ncbi:sensor histidine kinase [Profundibacter sp.]|uniref:sensor histidine kinase n=1 Tax=Profundibacter sp. TaxID=3101071 RepID=UPI003D0A2C1F